MKNKNSLTYTQIVAVALVTEFTLIAVQLVYLKIYSGTNEGVDFAFTSEYMKTKGFYIFQIIGFFLYTGVTYILLGKITNKIFNKLGALVVVGGIIELSFYLIMKAQYEGAFIYSILDKIIAVVFGLIVFNYTTKTVRKPDSYY
jgi:hypothetical protein